MPFAILDSCGDLCGWAAALTAAMAFGSYGLPVKSVRHLELDALVMQTYKTMVFFLTCWIALLFGEEVRFTSWGIAAALFWVPAGTLGVSAIKYAGMASAIGTWASLCVAVNFFWGIFIFQEAVKSLAGTLGAFLLLICGLVGMVVSANRSSKMEHDNEEKLAQREMTPLTTRQRRDPIRKRVSEHELNDNYDTSSSSDGDEEEVYSAGKDPQAKSTKERVVFFGGRVALTYRQFGLFGAVVNGLWGGTCLIPMHYASLEGYSGAGFVISFASGSVLVNAVLWLILFAVRLEQTGWETSKAIQALPPWYFRESFIPGIIAGILFSIGMFGSILAVHVLGQAVGNSCVEFQILVSGLWGICYHGEIQGRRTVTKWFLSATITVLGILWLSYEHESDRQHPRHH